MSNIESITLNCLLLQIFSDLFRAPPPPLLLIKRKKIEIKKASNSFGAGQFETK